MVVYWLLTVSYGGYNPDTDSRRIRGFSMFCDWSHLYAYLWIETNRKLYVDEVFERR